MLSFTDGAARTIWLVTHCVESMLVKCPMTDAAPLQALAGLDGGQPSIPCLSKKLSETVCSISGRGAVVAAGGRCRHGGQLPRRGP
ncbi:hypothetical protein [Janthinobacterium psychrotolerans]|uniref:hypothetical protein n=1 Tax=Janthinobacterium psychrotolerans TaxID=1747903 RepID=UPI003CCC2B4F